MSQLGKNSFPTREHHFPTLGTFYSLTGNKKTQYDFTLIFYSILYYETLVVLVIKVCQTQSATTKKFPKNLPVSAKSCIFAAEIGVGTCR